MVGRHFLLQRQDNHHVKRHYTISNCMEKECYEEYKKAIND
jgi:hypothetical protein